MGDGKVIVKFIKNYMDEMNQKLLRAFKIKEEEIISNRNGKLGWQQYENIRITKYLMIIFITFAFLLSLGSIYSLITYIGPQLSTTEIIRRALTAAVLFFGPLIIGYLFKNEFSLKRDAKVEMIQGVYRKDAWRYSRYRIGYNIFIGDKKLLISAEPLWVMKEGETYKAYYVPEIRKIVSVEM
jgi:hypothetical protein